MPPDNDHGSRARRFEAALYAASKRLGLDTSIVEPLRLHGSGIYVLRREGVVGRLVEATDENRQRASKALRVTIWLHEQGLPVVEPTSDRLIESDNVLVSFWHHLPQPEDRRPLPMLATALGTLLRDLHSLTSPSDVPVVEPLARLRAAMQLDDNRAERVLSDEDRRFIEHRMTRADEAYQALEFPLGCGPIHNDAHIDNLLVDPRSRYGYALTDWEGAGLGPREIDLIQEGAPGNRFRESAELRLRSQPPTGTTSHPGPAGPRSASYATFTLSRRTSEPPPPSRHRVTSLLSESRAYVQATAHAAGRLSREVREWRSYTEFASCMFPADVNLSIMDSITVHTKSEYG